MASIKNIVLDFGHGGIDKSGKYTTAPNKMFKFPNGEIAYEGFLNRQIGGLTEIYLRSNHPNFNIVTTVKAIDPRDLSLSYRVKVANQLPPLETIFISIHCNASKHHNASGFEIFTTKGVTKSDALATSIGNRIKPFYDKLNLKLRFDFDSDGDLDKEVDYYVLRKTKCPAVLLECLFFDFYQDFILLKNPEFQKELAWHIYQGILNFLIQN
ncbi:N-acetylmuramoyl-L-alanine amidase [Ulvibacterium sp.]|uniref:N-acetylmuramoyl-L-alanine amidase n=1 Tax=Ulvibacterium sp. TaxID=2665914 RepID=UPI0026333467|nr:N-acetylmuramoyl-L-alanine amidase [Ulvibacterium sp.]